MDQIVKYSIQILELTEPIYVIGRSVRVKHGTPECLPTIGTLISGFYTDGAPAKIANKIEPLVRFGICSGHVYYDEIIEFTYLTGIQVNGLPDENMLPETMASFTIPQRKYACIKVHAPNDELAIGTAYVNLDKWVNESSEWESVAGEYEVYPNESTNAKMELWRPIIKKR